MIDARHVQQRGATRVGGWEGGMVGGTPTLLSLQPEEHVCSQKKVQPAANGFKERGLHLLQLRSGCTLHVHLALYRINQLRRGFASRR